MKEPATVYRPRTPLGALRVKAGLSQRRAASRLGITYTYLSAIETGDRMPSSGLLGRLARLYRASRETVLDAAVAAWDVKHGSAGRGAGLAAAEN